jgi:hypothetical protein
MTMVDDAGKPDFRVTDTRRWALAVKLRTCAMCGVALGRNIAFIAGPVSFETRLFTDLPMHKDCALYAIQVCPFLAAPTMKYAETVRVEGSGFIARTPEMVSTRPDRFFVATTRGYEVVRLESGAVVVHATPWDWFEWWRHGKRIEGPV